jgi:D-alanyl-D-alanine carboxypeptidase/D-alanyl-D-alanine carboxypeptidase (penicillin-binding protein 5/6)
MQAFCAGRGVRNFLAALFAAGSIVLGAGAALAETSWAVFDVDSGVFVGEDGGSRIQPPASLTKMMTLYITFESHQAVGEARRHHQRA